MIIDIDASWLIVALIWGIANLVIGALIGLNKGRPVAGILYALLLGPIGWAIIAYVPDERRKCPHCAEAIKEEAKTCPHCRKDVDDGYRQWKQQRDQARAVNIEDPVTKWAREHPDEADRQ
jgi:hypothetical protein